jgi:hypothetical protein
MGLFSIFKKEPKQPDWISLIPKEMVEMMLSEIKRNPQACSQDEIPQGVGKFGLVDTNPIPVYGVPSNEIYLSRLKRSNGDNIRWRRIGSHEVNNITKPIDKYEIFDLKGNTIGYIFLNPYHWKISEKAPEGFKLV